MHATQLATSAVVLKAKLQPALHVPPDGQSVSVAHALPLLVPPSHVRTLASLLFSKFGQRSTGAQKPAGERPCVPLPTLQKPAEQVPVWQDPDTAPQLPPPGQSVAATLQGAPGKLPNPEPRRTRTFPALIAFSRNARHGLLSTG